MVGEKLERPLSLESLLRVSDDWLQISRQSRIDRKLSSEYPRLAFFHQPHAILQTSFTRPRQ